MILYLAFIYSDAGLAGKIGKALITTHDYSKAINYYEDVVGKNTSTGYTGNINL